MGEKIDVNNIPNHIAIMMDGNGRWARKRLLARSAGHRAGAQALRSLAVEAERIGIKYLTVFAFSTENWTRSDEEVWDLMNLLRDYIQQYINDTKKNDMKITVIGDRSKLDADLREKINHLESLTKDKKGLNVIIALNYGGRDEMMRAVKRIAEDVKKGKVLPDNIDESFIRRYLDTADIPEPELWIRTGGELRLSNFLLWQISYSELYFTDKLWPDFNKEDLIAAIHSYQQRERRFGGRKN